MSQERKSPISFFEKWLKRTRFKIFAYLEGILNFYFPSEIGVFFFLLIDATGR
jgi:hypothetical protein